MRILSENQKRKYCYWDGRKFEFYQRAWKLSFNNYLYLALYEFNAFKSDSIMNWNYICIVTVLLDLLFEFNDKIVSYPRCIDTVDY